MTAKKLNSESKIDDLIQFAKDCDLPRFNRTELAMKQNSLILRLDNDTLHIVGSGIMGSMYVPDVHKNYADNLVPNAEGALRGLFAGCEELASRKKVYDGVEDVDTLEIVRKTKSRQVAEAGARCSVILAEFRKLERIVKAFEESQNRSKDKSRAQRLYQGAGKKHPDGSWSEIDGYEVSGGVITELGTPVTEYLCEVRRRRDADRQHRREVEQAAQKQKQASA